MTIKSSHKIEASTVVESHGEEISVQGAAIAQWTLIHALAQKYLGKTVHGTTCKFEDDVWVGKDGGSENRPLYWQSVLPRGHALATLIKVVSFEIMSSRRIEVASLKAILHSLKKSAIPLMESKNLLSGRDGDYLLGLNHLTDDDLLVTIDNLFVSSRTEHTLRYICNTLSQFFSLITHISESVPVYQVRARLPWQKSGTPINSWIETRAADLGVIFRAIEGYEPLPTETVQPLIEKSLTLIDEHFDHFAAIGSVMAGHFRNSRYNRNFVVGLLEKYSPILGHIVTPPNIDGIVKTSTIARKVFIWFRELLYLARGACVNVTLLTTGLRNVDLRGLQVGACRPSGRVDMLFYLRSDIQKTKNAVVLPVPGQTDKAIRLLEKIKVSNSLDLIDAGKNRASEVETNGGNEEGADTGIKARLKTGDRINDMIEFFAAHFNIPFISPITGYPYTTHCYRTTVAGWLGAASNLSLLLVRRLFGHSNNVMPTVYLRNNPAFVAEREAQKARASAETARQMALAASMGRLAGIKGEQLERGYQEHKSRMESEKTKSHSLTDAEILMPFIEMLEQRIVNGSVCAFLTPFGVQCMRNPSDTSQPPCAKRANRDKTKGIAPELLKHISDINPQQCIGTSCTEAMLGPWSTSVLETLQWYRALLRHQLGDSFNEEHFIESAKQFIKQYEAPLKKVFGLSALTNDLESQPGNVGGGK